jgi:hypothetical protein
MGGVPKVVGEAALHRTMYGMVLGKQAGFYLLHNLNACEHAYSKQRIRPQQEMESHPARLGSIPFSESRTLKKNLPLLLQKSKAT